MLKIDAHNHPDFSEYGFEKIIENMNELGIDKAVLLSWESPWEENFMGERSPLCEKSPIPFERCLSYYEKARDRFFLGYCPDPRGADFLVKFKTAIELFDVKVCGEVKFRMMYDNPDIIDLFRFCGERGIPVTLHFDIAFPHTVEAQMNKRIFWYGGDIFTLERLLRLCPETNFLGHATGFWGCISGDDKWKTEAYPKGEVVSGGYVERLLEEFPNLYCDCSANSALNALTRDPAYTKRLMMSFPERFLYARDGFGNKLSEFIDGLELPEDVLKKFYYQNIKRLMGV